MAQFQITRVEATVAASIAYLREIDASIDELQTQLQLLQGVRRAVAGTFGVDRREDTGPIGRVIDAANRAEYEGDASTAPLVPRRVAS